MQSATLNPAKFQSTLHLTDYHTEALNKTTYMSRFLQWCSFELFLRTSYRNVVKRTQREHHCFTCFTCCRLPHSCEVLRHRGLLLYLKNSSNCKGVSVWIVIPCAPFK